MWEALSPADNGIDSRLELGSECQCAKLLGYHNREYCGMGHADSIPDKEQEGFLYHDEGTRWNGAKNIFDKG